MSEELGPLEPFCPKKRRKKDNRQLQPADIWRHWSEFVIWANNHPIEEIKPVAQKGIQVDLKRKVPRPYVLSEFLRFVGISKSKWAAFKESDDTDLTEVISDIEDMIEERQLMAGLAGQYNPTLTSQSLGLQTKIDMSTKDTSFDAYVKDLQKNEAEERAYQARKRSRERKK